MTTFDGLGTANKYVNQALQYLRSSLLVLSGSNPQSLVRNVRGIAWGYWWSNTGWGVTCQNLNDWYYTTGVTVVLDPRKSMPGGWYVRTAFPTR